jgi:hypothetical protein
VMTWSQWSGYCPPGHEDIAESLYDMLREGLSATSMMYSWFSNTYRSGL